MTPARLRVVLEFLAIFAIAVLVFVQMNHCGRPVPPVGDALRDQGFQEAEKDRKPVEGLPKGATGVMHGEITVPAVPWTGKTPRTVRVPGVQDTTVVPKGADRTLPPRLWPSPDDLSGGCTIDLVTGDGKAWARGDWTACLGMPDGSRVCRGPVASGEAGQELKAGPSPETEATLTARVAPSVVPSPWAAELRLMLTAPDPGIRLGFTKYGRGRIGWAADLEAVYTEPAAGLPRTWDFRAAGGVAIRLGRK